MTLRLSYDLASAGVTEVSGLARGIDTATQRAALEASGHTMSILVCAIDRIDLQRNITMAKKIIANGAVFTEYHPVSAPCLSTSLVAIASSAAYVTECCLLKLFSRAVPCSQRTGRCSKIAQFLLYPAACSAKKAKAQTASSNKEPN